MTNQAKVLKDALKEIKATAPYNSNITVRTKSYVRKGDRYYGRASTVVEPLSQIQIEKLKELAPNVNITKSQVTSNYIISN